ncbi:MAG: hypothetical protein RLZZ04_4845 [Cyanobacteriota bacterium]|jgi:hypothetical protein
MSAETKKYEGYWWLPENPDEKVTGSLSINSINRREGIELRIIGSLQSPHSSSSDRASPEIILGQAINGNLITLIDPIRTNSQSNSSNFSVDLSACTYRAQVAIIGKRHFNSKEDVVFTSADIRFSLLDEWLCQSGFSEEKKTNEQGHHTQFNLKYEYLETIEFNIDSIDLKFKTKYVLDRHHKYLYLKYEISQKSFFKVEPGHPQNLDWYNNIFESLRRFITVLSGFPVSITDIITYGNEYFIDKCIKTENFNINHQLFNNFIETFDKHPNDLLTRLDHIGIELPVILNNWFEKSEILEPAIILYVATLSIDLGYSEFRFLNYAQALEALHRRVFGGKYLTDEEYQPVCKIITNSIPKSVETSHRDSLKGRIKYGHEFSQRKRIKLLLDEVWEDCLDEYIDNKDVFIDKVINTRNYLIHYDSVSERQAAKGAEIFYIAEQLKIILIAHILLQLGIPKEIVYRDIKRFASFEYLKLKK